MSSRAPYRGGRNQWRRQFSDRPYGDIPDQYVTGDLHFQSVRDANRGFRPVENPNFSNHRPFRPRPMPYFNPRPPFNPSHPYGQQFRSPAFSQNHRFGPPPNQFPPFRPQQQQQFRPRPSKPLDYRNWEFARPGPPSDCERFTILSYNILADYLAINHRHKLYFHIPLHILDWERRKRNIVFELSLWSPDILCFQEVDRFQDIEEELKHRGYNGIWKMRTGDPIDGCAIFWRLSRFKLLHEESVEFNKLGLRDNVAQICVFESLICNDNNRTSVCSTSHKGPHKVVICNIHVLYNPKRGEIKLGQIRVLLERAHAVSELWDNAPIVLCGDFNCTPKSPLYDYISEKKLSLSGLARDKLSGQASAEIHSQRQFGPYFGPQSAQNSVQAPMMSGDREVRQNDSLLDATKQEKLDSSLENEPIISSSFQHQHVNVARPDSDDAYASVQNKKEEVGFSSEHKKKTYQDAVDGCKGDIEPKTCLSVSSVKGSPSSSCSEGGFSADEVKGGLSVNEVKFKIDETTHVETHHEDMYSNVIKTGLGGKVNPDLGASDGSGDILPHVNFDEGNISVVGDAHSSNGIIGPEPGMASREQLTEPSFPNLAEVPSPGNSGNLSSTQVVNDKDISILCDDNLSDELTSTAFVADAKMENLSLGDSVDVSRGDENISEDFDTFLSELHNTNGGSIPPNFSHELDAPGDESLDNDSLATDSVPVEAFRTAYNPSAWTPMEIETASGNAECLVMEHPLKLRSSYAEVQDCSGARDTNGEPLVTSYNRCFLGTVDYIWRSEGLQTVKVLAPIPKHVMQCTPGFPTKKWGSDHIALVSELAFTEDTPGQSAEAQ